MKLQATSIISEAVQRCNDLAGIKALAAASRYLRDNVHYTVLGSSGTTETFFADGRP